MAATLIIPRKTSRLDNDASLTAREKWQKAWSAQRAAHTRGRDFEAEKGAFLGAAFELLVRRGVFVPKPAPRGKLALVLKKDGVNIIGAQRFNNKGLAVYFCKIAQKAGESVELMCGARVIQ